MKNGASSFRAAVAQPPMPSEADEEFLAAIERARIIRDAAPPPHIASLPLSREAQRVLARLHSVADSGDQFLLASQRWNRLCQSAGVASFATAQKVRRELTDGGFVEFRKTGAVEVVVLRPIKGKRNARV